MGNNKKTSREMWEKRVQAYQDELDKYTEGLSTSTMYDPNGKSEFGKVTVRNVETIMDEKGLFMDSNSAEVPSTKLDRLTDAGDVEITTKPDGKRIYFDVQKTSKDEVGPEVA